MPSPTTALSSHNMSSDEVTLDRYLEIVFSYLVCKTIGHSFHGLYIFGYVSCWLTGAPKHFLLNVALLLTIILSSCGLISLTSPGQPQCCPPKSPRQLLVGSLAAVHLQVLYLFLSAAQPLALSGRLVPGLECLATDSA